MGVFLSFSYSLLQNVKVYLLEYDVMRVGNRRKWIWFNVEVVNKGIIMYQYKSVIYNLDFFYEL